MIIKNGLVWEESGSFRKKELVVDTTTHRIAETAFLRCDFILPDFHDPAGRTAYSCLCDD